MIDPTKITNYNRKETELEEFLLFCIMVAGKNAKQTAKKLDDFLFETLGIISPFDWIQSMVDIGKVSKNFPLDYTMKQHKLGQYKRLEKAFTGILQFKNRLKEVSVEELESVSGIGSKTSRFFVLHSRPNQQLAVLDTHILKWMDTQGYDVPKSTPPKGRYVLIEKQFLTEAWKHEKTPAEFDLEIWKSYAQNGNN
jgi:thermostable 8-oxoguanine DNA glycosylase